MVLERPFTLEEKYISDMCWLITEWNEPATLDNPKCKILAAALFSAKSTLPKGSPRRVFIQDLAASLNRKGLLKNEKVDTFTKIGYNYMEI
ncbi:MAG TPA: hypothetical protein ENH03_03820 [Candidatus Bathyarchaeota archaeon]|nr:hypothetical protein [Candidatus Bathyarchaeota archaeon]